MAQAHYRNPDVTLACERCCVQNCGYLQKLIWDLIKRFFFLKRKRKNVMFLKKIDLPYCLVVFFVVCPRLVPFWSVFGELALFWCSTAKRKTRQNSDFRIVRLSRRIIPLENYPRPQFLQKFKAEMSQFHVVHSLDSQFLKQNVYWRCFYLLLDRLPHFGLDSSKLPFRNCESSEWTWNCNFSALKFWRNWGRG